MYATINRIYENRNLILKEKAPTQKKSKVVIIFLESDVSNSKSGLKFGLLKGKVDTPNDFNKPL